MYSTAIVTGGLSGFGESIVQKLISENYTVCILDIDDQKGEEKAKESKNLHYIHCDVSNEKEVSQCINKAFEILGSFHVVVNSAGIFHVGSFVTRNRVIGTEVLDKYMKVNVNGTFNVCKFAAQKMMSQPVLTGRLGRGVIINVGSIAGVEGNRGNLIYSITKGAVVSMTLPMARDLGKHLIRVNCIAPSVFYTPMASFMSEDAAKLLSTHIAVGRIGSSFEFADCVYGVICSTYVNGNVIRLDGGSRYPLF